MLRCAFSQGHGKAAEELGLEYAVHEDFAKAIPTYHEGVKFGSEVSANALRSIFKNVNNSKRAPALDRARAERYAILADALYRNPDLRFPNLDKVLPLPPAALPKWDGNRRTLINAAKAVVPAALPPDPASNPASRRTGRANIPEGYVLPDRPQLDVDPAYETTRAEASGYWLARLMYPRSERHAEWDAAQVPVRYAEGELFDRTRPGLVHEDGRILFHYLGAPVEMPKPAMDPYAARGIAREVIRPEPARVCNGGRGCPMTGIWQADVALTHPLQLAWNRWDRQS